MNLTDMMSEPVIDHDWWEDGLVTPGEPTFDSEAAHVKNPNNVKPELAMEWGTAGMNIDLNEPAGVVERNIPDDYPANVNNVIIFARDQMNRGIMGKALTRSIRANFDQSTLRKAASKLRKQIEMDGIVGCVVLDARGYSSCREAMDAASNSPYKRFIKYVIGCKCGDPQMLPAKGGDLFGDIVASDKSGIDSFLQGVEKHDVKHVSHCRSTMLPLLSARGDLDESEMDDTMIDLMNVAGLSAATVQKIKKDASKKSNLQRIQAAFCAVCDKKEAVESSRYSGPIDASEHRIEVADNPLDIMTQIDQTPIAIEPHPAEIEVDFDGPGLDVDIGQYNPMSDQMEVAIDDVPENIEVDPSVFMDEEFEGTDVVELEPTPVRDSELDIDMRQDMQV